MRRLVFLALAILGTMSCSRVVEHSGQATGNPEATGVPVASNTGAFVQATIEIACLSTKIPDPRARVDMVWAIYRRYGFHDPDQYLNLVRSVGQQPPVQERIARGIEQCP